MKSVPIVQSVRAALSTPAAVQQYRRDGFLFKSNVLPASAVESLTAACSTVARMRGPRSLPDMDEGMNGKMEFDAKLVPKPGTRISGESAPAHLRHAQKNNEASKAVERRFRKVALKCKNQAEVDRVYNKLRAKRDRYMEYKNIPNLSPSLEEEEASGTLTDEKAKKLGEKHTFDEMHRSFEKYRDSGKMELTLRHNYHLDDVLLHLHNWARTWGMTWSETEELRNQILGQHSVGEAIGEAAASLSGGVVVRLFSDVIYDEVLFSNAPSMSIPGLTLNYRDPNGLSFFVGLDAPDNAARSNFIVLRGSHHAVLESTRDGRDITELFSTSVFDIGSYVRKLPGVKDEDVVVLPKLHAGDVFVINNYTACGFTPCLEGPVKNYKATSSFTDEDWKRVMPYQYGLTIMSDKVVFDGRRNSWMSKDSHGPLHKFKEGDPLDDEKLFPVLHRALDIE